MEDSIDSKAKEILVALSSAMKLEFNAPCLCGSGQQLDECCQNKLSDKIAFLKNPFTAAIKYRDSQGGFVKSLPQGIFGAFQKSSLQRLPCLYPNCSQKPSSCHMIPENILRSHFGGHCFAARLGDASPQEAFAKTGVGKAGALPVFCAEHDNNLFSAIDLLQPAHLGSPRHQFLLSFKAIAFALRKVQILLGIDLQTELFRPFFINEKIQKSSVKHVEIDISHLHIQYLRFAWLLRIFKESANALSASNWGWFSYFTRSLDSSNIVYFAGLANPSHDLEGRRVNTTKLPLSMACNFYTLNGRLLVLVATPNDGSSDAYSNLFNQFHQADDRVVVAVVNNIMTFAAEKPLLADHHPISPEDLQLIARQRARAARCLKLDSGEIFKLADPTHSVRFVSY